MALQLTGTNVAEALKVLQYPMPVKAEKVELSINGEKVPGARTAGRGKSYTYFEVKGAGFYVPGHLDPAGEYSVDFPADFTPKALKVTRAVVKKVKAPKADAAPATEGDAAPAVATEAEPTDAPNPFAGNRKAKRGQ